MNKAYLIDRVLHWMSAILLLIMLLNLSAELHTVDWTIKGQVEHRQDAVEKHGSLGLLLFVILLARILWGYVFRASIPRLAPKSLRHKRVTQIIHFTMYGILFLLLITGVLMIGRYELPLSVYGISFPADKAAFISTFPEIHQIHMFAREAIWWLIALHFVAVMAAKK